MKRSGWVVFFLLFPVVLGLWPTATASAEGIWAVCQIGEVTAYKNRVHIYCGNDLGGGVHFIASPTTDSDMYNRVLMFGTAAIAHGKLVTVFFDPADLSGVSWGCQKDSCRPALAVSLSP